MADDFDWPHEQRFRVVTEEKCWHKSQISLMSEGRDKIAGKPVSIGVDIDGIVPTKHRDTVEIAGLTLPQALEVIRGYQSLDIISGDLVKISRAYNATGNRAD